MEASGSQRARCLLSSNPRAQGTAWRSRDTPAPSFHCSSTTPASGIHLGSRGPPLLSITKSTAGDPKPPQPSSCLGPTLQVLAPDVGRSPRRSWLVLWWQMRSRRCSSWAWSSPVPVPAPAAGPPKVTAETGRGLEGGGVSLGRRSRGGGSWGSPGGGAGETLGEVPGGTPEETPEAGGPQEGGEVGWGVGGDQGS